MKSITYAIGAAAVAMLITTGAALADHTKNHHTSEPFMGAKANTGTVSHTRQSGRGMLRVSDDFKVPDTPAPTWRIVDSRGIIYTLDAFKIKTGEKREVTVPAYIKDIAKVQVYCAFAETLLGGAAFRSHVK